MEGTCFRFVRFLRLHLSSLLRSVTSCVLDAFYVIYCRQHKRHSRTNFLELSVRVSQLSSTCKVYKKKRSSTCFQRFLTHFTTFPIGSSTSSSLSSLSEDVMNENVLYVVPQVTQYYCFQ